MKKKSSRRRTKMVRRSKKNPRRTIKRKNIRKSGRRPTRRYSRIQRGGGPDGISESDYILNVCSDSDKFYEMGKKFHRVFPNDFAKAMKLYRLAAAQGNIEAQQGIGDLYRTGQGVERNNEEALKWYLIAGQHDECILTTLQKQFISEQQAREKEYNK
jgi:hypothetical protein